MDSRLRGNDERLTVKDLNTLAQNLLEARKKSLKNFDKIALTPQATKLVARLFYNPDCISLVNLDDQISDGQILLKDLARYMLTAAPSTLANYANSHHKVLLDHTDILDCFANDHQQAIKDNKIDTVYNPEYALSHILLSGKIIKVYALDNQKFANIATMSNSDNLTGTREVGPDSSGVRNLVFKKVLIPKDLDVEKGDIVWHHFGIIIDKFDGENRILNGQNHSLFFRLLNKESSGLKIDFSDKKIFHRDILGKIIAEQKNLKNKKRIISDPSISNIVLPKNSKIKFIH